MLAKINAKHKQVPINNNTNNANKFEHLKLYSVSNKCQNNLSHIEVNINFGFHFKFIESGVCVYVGLWERLCAHAVTLNHHCAPNMQRHVTNELESKLQILLFIV